MKKENLEIFNYLNKVYSKAKYVDYVKFLYQVYMGSSHYKTLEDDIIEILEKEKFNLKPKHSDMFIEPVGDKYVRMSLAGAIQKGYSMKTFVRLYILSRDYFKGSLSEYKNALVDLEEAIKSGLVDFDLDEFKSYIKSYSKEGYPPVRHSDKYKSIYNPHYLLISNEIRKYLPNYLDIDKLILENGNISSYLDSLPKLSKEFIVKHWKSVYPEIDI